MVTPNVIKAQECVQRTLHHQSVDHLSPQIHNEYSVSKL